MANDVTNQAPETSDWEQMLGDLTFLRADLHQVVNACLDTRHTELSMESLARMRELIASLKSIAACEWIEDVPDRFYYAGQGELRPRHRTESMQKFANELRFLRIGMNDEIDF